MKKLFIVGGIILSFSAANLFANGAFNSNSQAQALSSTMNIVTTPKKKHDTTKRKDTAAFAYNTVINDTTPKKGDTTKRKDSIAFAYNTVNLDTVPKKDTTKRKTDSIAYAINERK
jgi:hypothetical protein